MELREKILKCRQRIGLGEGCDESLYLLTRSRDGDYAQMGTHQSLSCSAWDN